MKTAILNVLKTVWKILETVGNFIFFLKKVKEALPEQKEPLEPEEESEPEAPEEE